VLVQNDGVFSSVSRRESFPARREEEFHDQVIEIFWNGIDHPVLYIGFSLEGMD
jgi:hypothetical protein